MRRDLREAARELPPVGRALVQYLLFSEILTVVDRIVDRNLDIRAAEQLCNVT